MCLNQLSRNVEEVLDEYYNGMEDCPDDYPALTEKEVLRYTSSLIYDRKVLGNGTTLEEPGICDNLRFLGNDIIYPVILKYANELGILKKEP